MMKNLQNKRIKNKIFVYLVLFFIGLSSPSFGVQIIRDSESEEYVREILNEILIVAEIPPKTVNLFLVKDDTINAFVFGGSNIFVNTGLIQSFNTYKPLQAVLAHEVGHLKGFHVIEFRSKLDKAVLEALFYAVSGAVIAVSGGAGASMITSLALGLNTLEKRILSYSRAQENEADFYAFKFLSNLESSQDGVVEAFTRFSKMQDNLINPSTAEAYKYNTTHPFPRERLEFFKNKFGKVKYKPKINPELNKKHSRVTAKLGGFLDNINVSYSTDFLNDNLDKMYFSAFLHSKRGNLKQAEEIFLVMLKKEPQNPYLFEVLSEIKQKNEKFKEALHLIQKALQIKPNDFLLLLQEADIYYSLNLLNLAIKSLNLAQKIEPFNPKVPFQLASVYSLKKEDALARLYFIESEVLRQNYKRAKILFQSFKSQNYKLDPEFKAKAQDIEYLLQQKI